MLGQQQQPSASRSQSLQDTDVPRGPVPTARHRMGNEHQHPQRGTQTGTDVQLCVVEMVLPIGWGGGKAATQSIALGACSTSDVLPWSCQELEKPAPRPSMKIHGVKAFTHKTRRTHDEVGTVVGQAAPANQNNLLVVQTQQHKGQGSTAGPASSRGQGLGGYRTQGRKRSCELLQSQGTFAGTKMLVRWLCQSIGQLPEYILAGTSRSSHYLSCSCAVTEDSGA